MVSLAALEGIQGGYDIGMRGMVFGHWAGSIVSGGSDLASRLTDHSDLCERSHMKKQNATSPRIVAFGDNDVDCYAAQGMMYPGGNALNVSVFSRRADAEAAFIGAMGEDPAGQHMRDTLLAEGAELLACALWPGAAPTA